MINALSIAWQGTEFNTIHIFIFGLMPCFIQQNAKVLSAWESEILRRVCVLERYYQSISLVLGYSHSLFPNIMAWEQCLLLSCKIKWSSWLRCLHSKWGLSVSRHSQNPLASKLSCRCGFFQILFIPWIYDFVLMKALNWLFRNLNYVIRKLSFGRENTQIQACNSEDQWDLGKTVKRILRPCS